MFWNNQTYIEDLQEKIGKPLTFMNAVQSFLGTDTRWWLIPSLPHVVPNFYEKVFKINDVLEHKYTKEQMKSEYYDVVEFKTKKIREIQRSKVETIAFILCSFFTVVLAYNLLM